jgi:ATP-binding cassette subfamily F protein 3
VRNGKKWSEYDLHVDRPLDVVEAVRAVNAVSMSSNRPPRISPRLKLDLSSGTNIIRVKEATIGYPDNSLFSIDNLYLRRGECAALIGPNGSGKTTFLKVLLGQIEPLEGSIRLGASLKIGYFAQAHDALNGDHSVLEELSRHKGMDQGTARSYLAQYLFRGDDVFKPVSALSGGERARLALAILALDGANFLLLDEPTNHLDIPAREALQEVLDSYSGTILLVSHDRYLIDSLATQIWELRENGLHIFNGKYREFILHRTAATSTVKDSHVLLSPRPMVRDNSRQTRQRELDLSLLEERIRAKEKEMQTLSRELERVGKAQAYDQVHELSWKVARVQTDLEDLLSEWEKVAA